MKRLLIVLAAALLVLAAAAPATAAPDLDKNKLLNTHLIACPQPLGTFTVVAKTTPGWPVSWEGVNTPIQFRAAESITVYWEGNVVYEFEALPPPGLEAKLVGPCQMQLIDAYPLYVEYVNAYFTLPRPWE